MKTKNKKFLYFLIFLFFVCEACKEVEIPIIPDQPVEPETFEPKKSILLQVSDWLACPGQVINLLVKDNIGYTIKSEKVRYHLSPEIGTIDTLSGTYTAPRHINDPIRVEILVESKEDTTMKSGRFIHLRPQDPKSYVLTQFSEIESAVDVGQLPDGSMVFASDNPAEPPLMIPNAKFEIFCTDQKGRLLWHTILGSGILRRIYVGNDAIYGIGYLDGHVVVKFDFKGNLLAKKYLEIEKEESWFTRESMVGAINNENEFVCMLTHATSTTHKMIKFDKDLNLISSISAPIPANSIIPMGNTGYLLTYLLYGDFALVNSDLSLLWKMNYSSTGGAVNGVIKNNGNLEIWTIYEKVYTNEIYLIIYDTNGNVILTKRLPFSEKLYFSHFLQLKQFENGDIWLITSSENYSNEKPFFENDNYENIFHLVKLSSSGEILEQTMIESLNFKPPQFIGGWPLKFFELYQGKDGLILAGKWYYTFLIQLNPNNSYSPC